MLLSEYPGSLCSLSGGTFLVHGTGSASSRKTRLLKAISDFYILECDRIFPPSVYCIYTWAKQSRLTILIIESEDKVHRTGIIININYVL